jgi:hypothetical protein
MLRFALRAAACAALTVVLAHAPAAEAGRCSTSLVSGGFHCGECPDPTTLLDRCNADETPVIYRLDQTFPADGTTTSSLRIRATAAAPCPGLDKTVAVTGYVVGCWSAMDTSGCRTVRVVNNGTMCLHVVGEPLGDGCSEECAAVSTEQIAISSAGAADRYVCAPNDPAVSCRSARPSGEEKFRLWIGGLCSTNGCDGDVPRKDTCTSEWGATLFGYSDGGKETLSPPGWYDWQSGAFNLAVTDGKSTCGTLGKCLGRPGNRVPWTLTIVGTVADGYQPPCLGDASNPCNPGACFP